MVITYYVYYNCIFPVMEQWMDFMCRLDSFCNSSTASGVTTSGGRYRNELWIRPSGRLFSFVPALFLYILILPFLPSSVFLYYFILAVPMREYLWKHSWVCSTFSFAILIGNCFCFLPSVQLDVHKRIQCEMAVLANALGTLYKLN